MAASHTKKAIEHLQQVKKTNFMENNSRRKFLQQATLLTAGTLWAGSNVFAGRKSKTFGIQLYSLKDEVAADAFGTLKKLAQFGYKQIESFEGKEGMFWGKSNKEFKTYANDLGMQVISSHCNVFENFEKKAAEAGEIGMKYLICPWLGPQKSIDDFKKYAAKFNECGEICKKNGIRFAYHNHDYSFKPLDGQLGQDVLMAETDANLVYFEMDMYWVVTAGISPIDYMRKHPGRFTLAHIKDRAKASTEQFDSCNLGAGSIDYQSIIHQAKKLGLQYTMVEQEKFVGSTPILSAEKNAAYMQRIL